MRPISSYFQRHPVVHHARPARLVCLALPQPTDLKAIVAAVDQHAPDSDLVLLPETCRGEDYPEPLHGETISALRAIARRHRTHLVCPIDRYEGGTRHNSTVLINRDGEVACVYNKVHLFSSELNLNPPREPGDGPLVHHTDFGTIGFATCFDVNFAGHWQSLGELGAELVVFPSAYSAVQSLASHAMQHNSFIAGSGWEPSACVVDLAGRIIRQELGRKFVVIRETIDLDRCVFHLDFHEHRLPDFLAATAADLKFEYLASERWFTLQALRPGVSARSLAAQWGFEELPAYRRRIRAASPASIWTGDRRG